VLKQTLVGIKTNNSWYQKQTLVGEYWIKICMDLRKI